MLKPLGIDLYAYRINLLGEKKINGCQDFVPQIFLDNPKVIHSLLPTLITVRHVLDAGSESGIHQHYGKP